MARGGFSSSRNRGFRGGGSFRSRGRGYRGRGRGRGGSNTPVTAPTRDEEGNQLAERFEQVRLSDEVDEKIGFPRIQEGLRREGWLINMHPVSDFVGGTNLEMLIMVPSTDSGEGFGVALRKGWRRLLLHRG